MDIAEDSQVLILLGRPFLATVGAIIDVKKGKLNLKVGDDVVEFSLAKLMKQPAIEDTTCFVDVTDHCASEYPPEPSSQDGLELCLTGIESMTPIQEEAILYSTELDKHPLYRKKGFEGNKNETSMKEALQ
ncbi:hypothetical protein A2U01_0045289, partial [Trifolium medium]|nr:hypothetical protein [Trifolium medium]